MTNAVFSLRDGVRELIQGAAGKIEVVFHPAKEGGPLSARGYAAVVCHPHPLFSGTMDNKVVTTAVRAYCELGVPTVRFNFRGVGETAGVHDQGRGEGDDLEVVAAWALSQARADKLLLCGFSFGSMVALQRHDRIAAARHLALLAPPMGRFLEDPPTTFALPLTLVVAEADEVVDAPATLRWQGNIRSRHDLLLIDGASHFFHGRLTELRERLQQSVIGLLGRSGPEGVLLAAGDANG